MKYGSYCIILFFFLYAGISCKDVKNVWENNDFEKAINAYCTYADSVGYLKNFDYILIEGIKRGDSIFFKVFLWGGAYIFITEKERIIDFINYKNHDMLLLGDFPNSIVDISKNKHLNPVEDIVKNRYPSDYRNLFYYNRDIGPLIYDYKTMDLIFTKNKLIYFKFSW